MGWIIPSDTHGAGDTGHIIDHNDIADVLTDLSFTNRSLYLAPSGATAETIPRSLIGGGSAAMTSGTLYVMGIGLHQNITVSNITFATKGTAETGGSHCWYVLLDSGLVVRSVTADQTGATFLASTNTHYTIASSSYTTTYSGLYYVGICVVASGMPQMAVGGAIPNDVASITPAVCGASSTGLTTPPTVSTTMGAITGGNYAFYAYTS